jgi:hypothetical protein
MTNVRSPFPPLFFPPALLALSRTSPLILLFIPRPEQEKGIIGGSAYGASYVAGGQGSLPVTEAFVLSSLPSLFFSPPPFPPSPLFPLFPPSPSHVQLHESDHLPFSGQLAVLNGSLEVRR